MFIQRYVFNYAHLIISNRVPEVYLRVSLGEMGSAPVGFFFRPSLFLFLIFFSLFYFIFFESDRHLTHFFLVLEHLECNCRRNQDAQHGLKTRQPQYFVYKSCHLKRRSKFCLTTFTLYVKLVIRVLKEKALTLQIL